MILPLAQRHRPSLLKIAVVCLLVLAVLATASPALAAEGKAGSTEAVLIGEIVLLIAAGRLLGYERTAFVPNFERILLAVDTSANARLAARLAGLLAGPRGMPVTVLALDGPTRGETSKQAGSRAAGETAWEREAAEIIRRTADAAKRRQPDTPKVDVIVRRHDAAPDAALAEEARRGYDLLLIGIAHVAAPRGGFHEKLSRLVGKFDGSLAVVLARGAFEQDSDAKITSLLTPVSGNENSRRCAEVALTLARSAAAKTTALSVTSPEARRQRQVRREARAIAGEIERIAEQLDTEVRMMTRRESAAEDAILNTTERGQHDLIVMGVSRRPGEALSFGDVADALIKGAPCSLLLVAPQMRGATKSATKGRADTVAAA